MKIYCFGLTTQEEKYFHGANSGMELVCIPDKIQDSAIADAAAEGLCVFVDSPVDEKILVRFPALKFIATRSTGFDHVDLKACAQRGVVVCNVPSYGEHTVAEFAMGLLLMLSRKLFLGVDRLKKTADYSYEGLQGFDLKGKTIGVIGTGRIGRHLITMAKGFGMMVVGYDPFPDAKLATSEGFPYLSLEELLKQSDVISIHVPYLASTHHLISAKELALMKPGSILLNVSRGGIIDTDALVESLRNGHLGGVGLDVLEAEGEIKDEFTFLHSGHPAAGQLKILLEDHELMHMDNVLMTPHMAFNTKEGVERILQTTLENIRAFASGKPINIVKTS